MQAEIINRLKITESVFFNKKSFAKTKIKETAPQKNA